MRCRRLFVASWLGLAACGPDQVGASDDGETGDEQVEPGDWLVYGVTLDDAVSLRAVDLGELTQGRIGPPVELLDTNAELTWLGPTPWRGYAFELDDAYMLIGLDADGQIALYPGVPEGVPAKARRPKYSADGTAAIFHGEYNGDPDDYYWVRFEHGHPVEGRSLGQMPAQNGNSYWISPDGSHALTYARDEGASESVAMLTPLGPEPGEPVRLWDLETPTRYVDELFDGHLFAWDAGQLHVGSNLYFVDMSDGMPGFEQQVSAEPILGGSEVWYSPSGDMVVWLDIDYGSFLEDHGRLWRVDIVDGEPLPAVELTEPGTVVHRRQVFFPSDGVVLWRPVPDEHEYTAPSTTRWVGFEAGELGPIHTIDDSTITSLRWSPDGRWLSWVVAQDDQAERRVAALGDPGVVHHLGQAEAHGSIAWIGERMLYATDGPKQLLSTTLGDDGPSAPTLIDPSLFEPFGVPSPVGRIEGHDAAVFEVDGQLGVLRFDTDGPLDATLIDDVDGQQSFVHQVRR